MGNIESLTGKSARIRDTVSELRRRFGYDTFSIVDCWLEDPEVIGIARLGEDEPCLCILTAGKDEGRFDVEWSGRLYRDCVIEGLTWIAREELQNKAHPTSENRSRGRRQ